MQRPEKCIAQLLTEKGWTLSTAESITGGGIGALLVKVPGASRYLMGGVIAYDNRIKNEILKVSSSVLETFGAVSQACAKEMAEGVASLFKTNTAIAVTGIAGPTGGSARKPVGLVYAGFFVCGKTIVKKYLFKGSRRSIMAETKTTVLKDYIGMVKKAK